MAREFLEEILAHKRKQIEERQSYFETVKANVDKAEQSHYQLFKKAISKEGEINLIAEIKKASPSKGVIREPFSVGELAKIYQENGAAAISVLTEEKYFLGSFAYLREVNDDFNLPTLTKDFIIDEGQIYEAFCNGASAILLIVAILSDEQMMHLMEVATRLDVDCLVEVHNEPELERALKCGAEIIGINNRNLHTFEVDLTTSERLIPQIPKDKVIVAESGISQFGEVAILKELGANAVLIGETFLRADDVGAKLKEVMYGQG